MLVIEAPMIYEHTLFIIIIMFPRFSRGCMETTVILHAAHLIALVGADAPHQIAERLLKHLASSSSTL